MATFSEFYIGIYHSGLYGLVLQFSQWTSYHDILWLWKNELHMNNIVYVMEFDLEKFG